MVRAILIDLDDTLSDDRFATEQAVLSLCRTYSESLMKTPADISALWFALTDKHWRRFRAGETTLQGQRRDRLSDLFGRKLPEARADMMFEEYLAHYEKNWRLVTDAPAFLEATSKMPKVIVTNGEADQAARKVTALNLGGHIMAVVTPELAGASKPKPEIFLHAIRVVGLPAEDCMMIGDSYEYDIAPAQALGMATFHVGSAAGKRLLDAAHAT